LENLLSLLQRATGLACDSRKVKPGDLFFAIRGRAADGNQFAAAAARQGALAVVTEMPEGLPDLPIPVCKVPCARQALAELAACFYRHPSRGMALAGVTGTNGKTTVTFMLEHIFRQAGFTTGLIGTVCVNAGRTSFASTLTTPDALTLQQYLAMMRQNGVTHAAMEVSAQGIEMQRVHGVRFSCGILTNISPDHLDFHGNFAAYRRAKENFTSLLATDTPLIINASDPYCRSVAARHPGPVVTVAVTAPADVEAQIIHCSSRGSTFQLDFTEVLTTLGGHRLSPGPARVLLKLPGRHNVENAAMAITTALLHDVPVEIAVRAMATFSAITRRMEVFHLAGLTVVDDTALNPGSINAVFDTLGAYRHHRLIVVAAIRGCRGAAINTANAQALAEQWRTRPFALFVTASQGSVGAGDMVSPKEKSAFCQALEAENTVYQFSETLPATLTAALDSASSGDLLLLLGAQGMDDGYQLLRKLTADRPRSADCFDLQSGDRLI